MRHLFLATMLFLFPFNAQAGLPEGKNGYDLKKIEESFRLPCDEIGNDDCIARALGIGACVWIFEINKDKETSGALKIADTVLIALLKGNNLDLKSMLERDGLIKKNIRKEATYRINFCREEIKKAIPKLIKKLPEGVVLDEEKIEDLTSVFPLQYLSMLEQISKLKK
tara:strand:- start:239 stop:742 length:504 start_codon:yes stop_codon:yes gene_type:complete